MNNRTLEQRLMLAILMGLLLTLLHGCHPQSKPLPLKSPGIQNVARLRDSAEVHLSLDIPPNIPGALSDLKLMKPELIGAQLYDNDLYVHDMQETARADAAEKKAKDAQTAYDEEIARWPSYRQRHEFYATMAFMAALIAGLITVNIVTHGAVATIIVEVVRWLLRDKREIVKVE